MVDAYDVLNLGFEATEEEIKKAYKRRSLELHPDKRQGVTAERANADFHELKLASDILQDTDRRKIYDTFGFDCGEEKPEMEIWGMGMSSILSPLGLVTLKTLAMRAVIWTLGWRWIGYLVFLATVVAAALFAANVTIRGVKLRSEDGLPLAIGTAIVFGLTVVVWIWTVLADAVGIFCFIASSVVDPAMLLANWKLAGGIAVGSLLGAWLVQNWWFWICVLQVVLVIAVLISVSIASELVKLWIDNLKTQHGDELKERRLRVRTERKALQAEAAELRRKLQEIEDRAPARSKNSRR